MPLESIGTDSDIFKSPHTIGTAQRHLWNHSMALCYTSTTAGHGEDPSPTAPSPDGRNSHGGGSPRDRHTPDFDESNSFGGYKPARSDPWSSRGNPTEPGISRSSSKRSVLEDVLPEPERRVRYVQMLYSLVRSALMIVHVLGNGRGSLGQSRAAGRMFSSKLMWWAYAWIWVQLSIGL